MKPAFRIPCAIAALLAASPLVASPLLGVSVEQGEIRITPLPGQVSISPSQVIDDPSTAPGPGTSISVDPESFISRASDAVIRSLIMNKSEVQQENASFVSERSEREQAGSKLDSLIEQVLKTEIGKVARIPQSTGVVEKNPDPAKTQEKAKQAEQAQPQDPAKQSEHVKQQEKAKQAEQAKQQEKTKQSEQAKQQEKVKQAEEAKQRDDAKRLDEEKKLALTKVVEKPTDAPGGPSRAQGMEKQKPAGQRSSEFDPRSPVTLEAVAEFLQRSGIGNVLPGGTAAPPANHGTPVSANPQRAGLSEAGEASLEAQRQAMLALVEHARKTLEDARQEPDPWPQYTYRAANQITTLLPETSIQNNPIGYYWGPVDGKTENGTVLNGELSMSVHFNDRFVAGGMHFDGGLGALELEGVVNAGGTLHGAISGANALGGTVQGGSFNGHLFGPAAQEIGGAWNVSIPGGALGNSASGMFAGEQVETQ